MSTERILRKKIGEEVEKYKYISRVEALVVREVMLASILEEMEGKEIDTIRIYPEISLASIPHFTYHLSGMGRKANEITHTVTVWEALPERIQYLEGELLSYEDDSLYIQLENEYAKRCSK